MLGKYKETIKLILIAVAAFLGSYGVNYMYSLTGETVRPEGFLSVLLFGMTFVLLKITWENVEKLENTKARVKRLIFAFVLAAFFCAMLIMGYQLEYIGVTDPGMKGKGMIFLRAICMSFVAVPFTNALFAGVEKAATGRTEKEWNAKYVFFISWGVLFLCWIPVFLAYYPAIMSHDFHRQSIEAASGFHMFDPYQPLAHTWLIWLAFQIGEVFGSLQTGMAVYSIFQMLVFSVSAAYSCSDTCGSAWAAFAYDGNDPTGRSMPKWLPYDQTNRYSMHFKAESELISDYHGEGRKILEELKGANLPGFGSVNKPEE